MKSTLILVASGAALALAGAVDKRYMVTEVETVYKTVTVTEGEEPTSTPAAYVIQGGKHRTRSRKPITTSAYVPEPEPTTYEVVVTTTPYVAPTPTPETYVEVKPVETYAPQPTTTQAAYPTAPTGDFASACLSLHNGYRSKHGAGSLVWDDALASDASHTSNRCDMEHEVLGAYGQNLASYSIWGASPPSQAALADNAITGWYSEVSLYPGGGGEPNMGNFEAWGHVSQLLWKGSTKLGCAIADCSKGDGNSYQVTCNYQGAGNVAGSYAANVQI